MQPELMFIILSALLQAGTAVLALRQISLSRGRLAWILIATALSIRSVHLGMKVQATLVRGGELDFYYELIGLLISLFLALGVYSIGPLFMALRLSEAEKENALQLARQKAEETEKARLEAEKANNLKSQFIANISHEMRTPLTVIISTSDLLAENRSLDEPGKRLIRMLQTSSDILHRLIEDVLDFSAIEVGIFRSKLVPFDLRQRMAELVLMFSEKAQRKGLKLLLRISPEIPTLVSGDPERLSQIMMNLIGNALKFTAGGEVEVTVGEELPTSPGKCRLRFSVRDTGIGIPASQHDLLFKPFTQLNGSLTRRFGGTGLGLALSRRIVEKLGGSIGFTSEEGKGSTFFFILGFDQVSHPAPA